MPGGFFAVESLRNVHVLIVTDDAALRRLLGDVLTYCGALTTLAAWGDETLRILDLVRPDAVVTDVGVDAGDDVMVRAIRSRKPEGGGIIPVVGVSRSPAGRPAGFDAVLTVPVDPWEMCRTLSNLTGTGGIPLR